MRTVETSQKAADNSLNSAFTDLNALMESAAEMVKLAESITVKLAQSSTSSGGGGGANGEGVDMVAFRSYLVDLGITSPVTRQTAGDMYTQELSRQLAEFLEKVLIRSGGMMSLMDVYCLFNRARGVALISPEDLQKSCALFTTLNLPFRLRRFDSGLLVVQSESESDENVCRRVWEVVKKREGGVTKVEVARAVGVGVVLAGEWLLMAEKKGLICRDDTVEGLRFWDNLIMGAEVASAG